MTDEQLGVRILQAVESLKRAKAELEALAADLRTKQAALAGAGDLVGDLEVDDRGRLVRHSSGGAVEAWPTFDDLSATHRQHREKSAEVARLRDSVKRMTGLDQDLLS